MTRESAWSNALSLHETAISEFIHAAGSVPLDQWATAEADQWAPAHVTEHLTLIYEVLLRELQGGVGMKIRTNFFTQRLLRWFLVPKMLRGSPFPRARAPRETRPVLTRTADQTVALETLKQLAGQFQQTMVFSFKSNPNLKLTHAYFGSARLEPTLLLCARHIQHHTRGLNRADSGNQKL